MKRIHHCDSQPLAWLAIAILHSAGCAMPGADPGAPIGHQEEDMRAYTERVFRLQNRVMETLIMRSELDGDDPALERIELGIVTSCRYLNESAALHATGEEPPVALKMNVLDTVEDCEDAAEAGDRALLGKNGDSFSGEPVN